MKPARLSIAQQCARLKSRKPGGPEVLKPAERPKPPPKADEILIKVAAAGVNRPDVLQRMGHYPVPPDASDLPGLEIAGEVVASAPAKDIQGRRQGLRAGPRRRLRRVLRRARSAGAAGAQGPVAGRGGLAARDLLHRLGQRLRPRAARAGRNAARAGRQLGHRRHRDPDGGGDGQPRVRHRRLRREGGGGRGETDGDGRRSWASA